MTQYVVFLYYSNGDLYINRIEKSDFKIGKDENGNIINLDPKDVSIIDSLDGIKKYGSWVLKRLDGLVKLSEEGQLKRWSFATT